MNSHKTDCLTGVSTTEWDSKKKMKTLPKRILKVFSFFYGTTTLVSGERVLVQEDNVARTGITQITPHTNHTSFTKERK